MNNKLNLPPLNQNEIMELLSNAVKATFNYFLIWDQEDRLAVYDQKLFEFFPYMQDIFVPGRTFEEILHMGFELNIFEAPEKVTVEQYINQRLALHRQGTYSELQQVGDLWLQIKDQKTESGHIVTIAIDVTNLKKQQEEELALAKEQANQAENRLWDALDSMSDAFLLWDKKNRLVLCNKRLFDLYPQAQDIFVEKRCIEDILRVGLEKGVFELPEGMTKREWIKKRTLYLKSGNYLAVRKIKGKWLQIRDQRTNQGNIVTTSIDVTPLKEKEQQLEKAKEQADQAESLLRDALDTMSNGFSLWDKEGRFIYGNKKFFEFYPNLENVYAPGYTYEEILRRGIEKGDFVVPKGMTKKEWIKERAALHKSGDYRNVEYVKGQLLQIRDQRTTQGNIVTTAIDMAHLKAYGEKFVQVYGIGKPNHDFKASKDYQHITLKGENFYIGSTQGKIIRQLHKAYLPEDPENSCVHKDVLMDKAGSEAKRLRDVFSNDNVRKALIRYEGKGRYRLNLP